MKKSERVSDFTFIHTSDGHIFHDGTAEALQEIGQLAKVELTPYHITASKPEFIIDTGDCTEFGLRGGAFDTVCSNHETAKMPYYIAVGNHDQTWGSISPEIRKKYGNTYYSFDSHGVHFIILESASLQDPRPSFSAQELIWLKSNLESVGSDTPVVIAFHHPIDISEFSSEYDVNRLIDIIRPYNVVVILDGHGHTAEYKQIQGIDTVQGGCPWGGQPGYQVASVQNGVLRIAYKLVGDPTATIPMLEKSISPRTKAYPRITIGSPAQGSTVQSGCVVEASIDVPTTSATAKIDDLPELPLAMKANRASISMDTNTLEAGAHTIRINYKDSKGAEYSRSSMFYTRPKDVEILWRTDLQASSKSTAAIAQGIVVVGDNAGYLHALDQRYGRTIWKQNTGGSVVGEPLILGDTVVVGSDNGLLSSWQLRTGNPVWVYDCKDPIYSSAVSDGRAIYICSRNGSSYAVDAKTGVEVWHNTSATYNVEGKPFLSSGRLIYGAWDSYVYCVDCRRGDLVWKCMCKGSAEGIAPAYYSASDAGPVQCGNRVFIADRKYRMSIINARTGVLADFQNSVSAVALSSDSRYVYTRGTNRKLNKLDVMGRPVWSVDAATDYLPTPPLEKDGRVYIGSGMGKVQSFNSSNGKLLWSYQATPQMYMFAGLCVENRVVYAVGSDGMITAIREA